MKKLIFCIGFAFLANSLFAQNTRSIVLNPPDTTRGFSVMKSLSLRASATKFDTTNLNLQDLSDLLWAADGINRHEIGKRTAPSAMNAQDIDVYLFNNSGIYLYNASKQVLDLVVDGDNRGLFPGRTGSATPSVICLLVSDISRFRSGSDSLKMVWAGDDAGIVSQNISVFCASVGFATRPRSSMDQQKLRALLKLKDTQFLMLNQPVSYKKEN
jgi:nitroreductase